MDQLIREMNQISQAVRITEGKFILGDVYRNLSEIPEGSKIFSIEFLEDVI
jgi:ribosomal protein L16/L10AE